MLSFVTCQPISLVTAVRECNTALQLLLACLPNRTLVLKVAVLADI